MRTRCVYHLYMCHLCTFIHSIISGHINIDQAQLLSINQSTKQSIRQALTTYQLTTATTRSRTNSNPMNSMAHIRADSAFSNHKSHLLDALEEAITESNNRLNAAEQMPFNAYRRQDIFLHPNGYLRTNTALRSYQGPAFYSEILADLEDLEEGFMHAEQLVEENNRIVVTEVMGLESLGDGLVKAAREGGQEVWYQALVWNGEDYDSGGLSSACSEDIDSLEFGKLETEERNERERTLRGRAARAAMLSPLHTTGSTTQSPSPFDDNMDAAAIEKKMAEIEAAKEKIDQHRIEVAKGTMNMLGLGVGQRRRLFLLNGSLRSRARKRKRNGLDSEAHMPATPALNPYEHTASYPSFRHLYTALAPLSSR